jgi:hypothetical protein
MAELNKVIEQERVAKLEASEKFRDAHAEQSLGLVAATRITPGFVTDADRDALRPHATRHAYRMLAAAMRAIELEGFDEDESMEEEAGPEATPAHTNAARVLAHFTQRSNWASATETTIADRLREQHEALKIEQLEQYTANIDQHRIRLAQEDAEQAARDTKVAALAVNLQKAKVAAEKRRAADKAKTAGDLQFQQDIQTALELSRKDFGLDESVEEEGGNDSQMQEFLRQEAARLAANQNLQTIDANADGDVAAQLTIRRSELTELEKQLATTEMQLGIAEK